MPVFHVQENPSSPATRGIASVLSRICLVLERSPWLGFPLIILVYLPYALETSRHRPLWHDELFTFWIAQAPTLATMWTDLRTLDLNPPLVYVLTRLSFYWFGVSTLTTRLPEIFGLLIALLAIFQFVRTRLGTVFGLFTVTLLIGSDISELGVDARPYSLVLGFLALALVSWQSVTISGQTGRNRLIAIPLIFLAVAGMLLSHIFALLAVAALGIAEIGRQFRNRKLDLPILMALALPLAAVITYLPMLRNHSASIFPQDFQPTIKTIFIFYIVSIARELIAICLAAACALVFLRLGLLCPAPPLRGPRWFFTLPEWWLIIGLMVAPLLLLMELIITHGAFFSRYGAIESVGVALIATAILARWTIRNGHPDGRAALLGCLVALAMSGAWTALPRQLAHHTLIPTAHNSEPVLKACQACAQTESLDPSIPLVDASGLTFVEMNHREDALTLSRLFYLTDPSASKTIAHANIFEQEAQVAQAFHFAARVEPYAVFLAHHTHFFVFGTYDYPEDWLLRKLIADHADIRVVSRTFDDYRNTELYEVRIAPESK